MVAVLMEFCVFSWRNLQRIAVPTSVPQIVGHYPRIERVLRLGLELSNVRLSL
jgi:hypothetical protein